MTAREAEPHRGAPPVRRYRVGRAEVDEAIERLVALAAGPDADTDRRATYVREIVTSAVKLLLDEAATGDVKLVNSAVKELRYAFKVFAPYRVARKVTVFGSARTQPHEPAFEQAQEFGASMATHGWMIITGAGPGIMAAAHGGAGRQRSFGVNIHLPFEQAANETVRGDDKLINFKYFFTRKLVFLKETDAIVLFPGGFGTHDEGFETLTLIQTGKAEPMPVVFVEPPGSDYWAEWHEYVVRHLEKPGLISPNDTRLYLITDDVSRAVDEVCRFYRVYHSQRYVGDRLVLRLLGAPSPEQVEALNAEFGFVLSSGRIEASGPLPEEDEPDLAALPRLVLRPRRDDPAAIRLLLDRVNALDVGRPEPAPRIAPAGGDARAERGAVPGAED
jgi:hypothetical protein